MSVPTVQEVADSILDSIKGSEPRINMISWSNKWGHFTVELGYVYGEISARLLVQKSDNSRKELHHIYRITSDKSLQDMLKELK